MYVKLIMAYTYYGNVLSTGYSSGYDDLERRVDRLVSGQFAQEARYGSNSYQNDYAKAAFYQSLCNTGYSSYSGSSSSGSLSYSGSSSPTNGAWCSNGIF